MHQDITRHLFLGPSDLGTILPCPSGDSNKIDNCLCGIFIFSTIYYYENHNIAIKMSSSSRADTDSVLAGGI